jgi:MarR family transcriptional regulator, organic hydroperoxide resistance regulator
MTDLRRVFSELERTSAQLAAAMNLRLQRETGLPLVMFEPMSVIADCDICRVYELATQLGVSAGGASKLVDRLKASGYCRRYPNPDDRRSSLLKLTPAGTVLLATAEQVLDAGLQDTLGCCLSEAETAQLAAVLHHLLGTLLKPG